MDFSEFKKEPSQAPEDSSDGSFDFSPLAVAEEFKVGQTQRPTPSVQLTDVRYSPPKRVIGWWRWVMLLIFSFAAVGFVVAVAVEIGQRQSKMEEVIRNARQMTSGGKLENNSLVQELMNRAGSSTGATSTTGKPAGSSDKARALAESESSPRLGNASSSLVIVEFADFNCPVCLQEFPIIRSIASKYQKELLFIFRNYPVKGNDSIMLAQASLCANEQGGFWQFHDRLFSNQGKIVSTEDVKRVAVMSGLDWDKLNGCVSSEKYKQQVVNDTQDAMDLGVRGTPTFFINGIKLEGAVSAAAWEDIINKNKELQNK